MFRSRGGASLALLLLFIGVMAPYEHAGVAQEVVFPVEFLKDPTSIALGKKLWSKRCRFCHGKAAYPGTAPQLRPWRYKPEFIYDRITNGFRGMPALKHEFSEQERKAIVAYVLSRQFSP